MGFPETKETLHENNRWFEYFKLISAIQANGRINIRIAMSMICSKVQTIYL